MELISYDMRTVPRGEAGGLLGYAADKAELAMGDVQKRPRPATRSGVMSAVRISFLAKFQPRFFKFQLLGAGF